MPTQETVLLLGGTGRTGRRVLLQLLQQGFRVRAIVRDRAKLPAGVSEDPKLTSIEASLLCLPDETLRNHLAGCSAVVSCLGHVISFKGIFGPPHDLVTQATKRLCRQIEALSPATPIKFVLMSSVSVHRSRAYDRRRGAFERAFLWLLRCLVPPAKDNQRAADFLIQTVGPSHPFVEWVAVRPDSLLEGEVSPYERSEELTHSVFAPASTNMANVAHFMCELIANPSTWATWRGKLPVIYNSNLAHPT